MLYRYHAADNHKSLKCVIQIQAVVNHNEATPQTQLLLELNLPVFLRE